jgi:hypothetical protein
MQNYNKDKRISIFHNQIIHKNVHHISEHYYNTQKTYHLSILFKYSIQRQTIIKIIIIISIRDNRIEQ